jgi:uncharacterized delta-60 repeat protein
MARKSGLCLAVSLSVSLSACADDAGSVHGDGSQTGDGDGDGDETGDGDGDATSDTSDGEEDSSGDGDPEEVTVSISPKTVTVGTNKSTGFIATVMGTNDQSVTWSVVENGGGTVTDIGLYTAPLEPGTFHVRVSSDVDPSAQATATVNVESRAGKLDPTFTTTKLDVSWNDRAWGSALAPDGSLIVVGETEENPLADTTPNLWLTKVSKNGGVSSSFGDRGNIRVTPQSTSTRGHSIAFADDGSFYASGCFSEPLNSFNRQILTVNSNAAGEFEGGFGNGGVAVFEDVDDEECGSATLPLTEGGLVVGGYGQLRRMNESGVELPDFGVGGVVNVVIPEFWSDYWLGSTYRVIGLLEDSLGRILVLGSAPFDGDAGTGIALARYETDGTLDESFGGDGVVLLVKDNLADTKPRDFLIQANGQIVVVGEHDYAFFATRVNQDGALDQSFGTDGWATHVYDRNVVSPKATSAEAVTLQDDGKITILCEIQGALGLVQFDVEGEVNFNFGDDEGDGWTYFTSEGETYAIDLQYEASGDRHLATINTSDYPSRSVHVYGFLGH